MLQNLWSKRWWNKMKLSRKRIKRQHEKESFNARIMMERRAQAEIAARLRAVEITLKNQGRRT